MKIPINDAFCKSITLTSKLKSDLSKKETMNRFSFRRLLAKLLFTFFIVPLTALSISISLTTLAHAQSDFDGDTIDDTIDLDDDNDGVLDADEYQITIGASLDNVDGTASAQVFSGRFFGSDEGVGGVIDFSVNFTGVGQATDNTAARTRRQPQIRVDGGLSYLFNDNTAGGPTQQMVLTANPATPISISTVEFGPALADPRAAEIEQNLIDTNADTIVVSWTGTDVLHAIVNDPLDQLNEATGTILNNGDSITQGAAIINGQAEWSVTVILLQGATSADISFTHQTTASIAWEGFGWKVTPFLPVDSDGDGQFNHFDIDSDNDLCSDAREAGIDVTGLTLSSAVDSNNGGATIEDAVFLPADFTIGANGFADDAESAPESGVRGYGFITGNLVNDEVSACNVEICGNGIDDNGNGFIDHEDPTATCDCNPNLATANFCNAECSVPLVDAGNFDIANFDAVRTETPSAGATLIDTRSPVLVGDIDGDGSTEIIARGTNNEVVIHNGTTLVEESKFPFTTNDNSLQGQSSPWAMADVDLDGDMEICMSDISEIACYQHDGTEMWKTTLPVRNHHSIGYIHVGFADFN